VAAKYLQVSQTADALGVAAVRREHECCPAIVVRGIDISASDGCELTQEVTLARIGCDHQGRHAILIWAGLLLRTQVSAL
jgi:hypothetical protein